MIGIHLDLGCGIKKQAGYIGIDKRLFKGVGIICDFDKSIPVKGNSVTKIYSNGLFAQVNNLVLLFQEVYRICKKNAQVVIVVPYYFSSEAFKNPLNRNFFTEGTFRYFSSDKWYGSDYGFNVNFELLKIVYQYTGFGRWLPFKKYIRRYLVNVVDYMEVELKVIK